MLLNGLGISNKVSSLTKNKINLRGDIKTVTRKKYTSLQLNRAKFQVVA